MLSVVEIEFVLGNDHLMVRLNAIVKDGGEGLILTKPKSLYVPERQGHV